MVLPRSFQDETEEGRSRRFQKGEKANWEASCAFASEPDNQFSRESEK
jgi:hypothetical protein